MTKIKNTKKGMAKKTLSMSLVVAMLATSNVPVWAAEFSDGTDAAVATEAPTAEAFTDEAAPVVEDTTDAVAAEAVTTGEGYDVAVGDFTHSVNDKDVALTNNATTWQDASNIKVTFTLTPKEGTSTAGVSYYYAWKVDGIAGTATEIYGYDEDEELGTKLTIAGPTATANDTGKDLTLFIYAVANDGKTVWSYTSDAIALKAVDRTETMKNLAFTNGFSLTYDGKQKTITKDNINWGELDKDKYDIAVSSSDDTNVTTNDAIKVTITPNEVGYTGKKELTIGIDSKDITDGTEAAKALEVSLKTTKYVYTGKTLKVKASDVSLIDKDTKADLSAYLDKDEKGYVTLVSAPTATGEYNLTVKLIKGKPENGNKNYNISEGVTLTTTNQAAIEARDLSTVDVSIKSMAVPTAASGYTSSDLTITYKDKTTGEELTLGNDVDVTIPKDATTAGSYTVTLEAKTGNENVKGKTTATLTLVNADLSNATFSGDAFKDAANKVLKDEEYIGEAITKTEKQLGNLMLNGSVVNKSEYSIEYAKNTNAGTASLIVKGKNSFAGSEAVFTFTINPAGVTDDTVTANETVEVKDTQTASDYKGELGLVVKAKNENNKEFTLVDGTDYTVKYAYGEDNVKTAGGKIVATITITNKNFIKNNNAKEFTKEVTIAPTALKTANIKLKENSFTYTGKAITPEFDVVVDGKVIAPSRYTTTYTNNINAGTATISVKGTEGSGFNTETAAKLTFEIKPADASKLVGVIASEQYRGYSIEIPAEDINLKLGDNVVDVAENFKLTYGENLNIGEGTVTLTPKNGNFTGTKTLTFDIVGNLISNNSEDAIKTYDSNGILTTEGFEYDGTTHTYAKAVASLTSGAKKLVEGKDYDLVYVDNVYGKQVELTEKDEDGDTYTYYVQRGAILAVAKGTYGGNLTTADEKTVVKGVYTDAAGNKTANVIAIKTFDIAQQGVNRSNITVKNATYAGGLELKPAVSVVVKGVTLVEGKDYVLHTDGTDLSNVTTGKTNWVWIEFKNGYRSEESTGYNWGIDKFDLANADVTVDGDKVTVKCGRVDVETSEYTVEKKDGKVTVAANKSSKNYTGTKTVNAVTEDQKPGAPMISSVKVTGNKATVILSGDTEGAAGYDYVISTDRDCITNKNYDSISKNQVQTSTTFKYVQQGTYYAYCHAWKRDENGKKVFSDWSNAYPFVVSAITPDAPVITNVTVSGSTIKVTYKAAANATGYDVVLGTSSKKENGETRPYNYGAHKKLNLKEGTVTATFKNVPKGTWTVGMHAFNRTSEDGKKVFSPWSNLKKATVK